LLAQIRLNGSELTPTFVKVRLVLRQVKRITLHEVDDVCVLLVNVGLFSYARVVIFERVLKALPVAEDFTEASLILL